MGRLLLAACCCFIAVAEGEGDEGITTFIHSAVFLERGHFGEGAARVEKRVHVNAAPAVHFLAGLAPVLPSGDRASLLQKMLTEEWAARSYFRASPGREAKASRRGRLPSAAYAGTLEKMRSRRAHLPPLIVGHARDDGGGNATRPLLCLLHPSSIGWPARLDVLVTALTALESSANTGKHAGREGYSDSFDLVVVVDSPGEYRTRHECNAKATAMMQPIQVGGNQFICDSAQFLEAGSIPFIISHSDAHSSHLQGSDRRRGPLSPSANGGESLANHLGVMRAAAVRYAERNGYAHLVLASSASLIASDTVTQLSNAVAEQEAARSGGMALVTPVLGCPGSTPPRNRSCSTIAGVKALFLLPD